MIGAQESGEVGFMNALSHKQRPAAAYLINQLEVVDLVDIFYNGPTLKLQKDFPLDAAQWPPLISAVLLTRFTMFHPNLQYPKAYLKFLLNLSFKAYSQIHQQELKLIEIPSHAERETPYFSQWFKQLLLLYQRR